MTNYMDYYGLNEYSVQNTEGLIPARITAVHRNRYEAVCSHGAVYATLKSGSYYDGSDEAFPSVGDYVQLLFNPAGDSQITKTVPRKSKFSRNNFNGHAAGYAKTIVEQVVAANFDYVFIVTSMNQDFNGNKLQRYLVQAWQSGGTPVVILTKADLAENPENYVAKAQGIGTGVAVIAVSAKTGLGLEQVKAYLKPKVTVALLGSSGVGKSSLVNALAEEELMRVNEIREDDARGRHTTTHRQMIALPWGAFIIDTPGMRELGFWDAAEGLSESFSDIESLFSACRFSDCQHETEPGCAVSKALEEGTLDISRWQQYQKLKKENRFVEDKAAYHRESKAWGKQVKKQIRGMQKGKQTW